MALLHSSASRAEIKQRAPGCCLGLAGSSWRFPAHTWVPEQRAHPQRHSAYTCFTWMLETNHHWVSYLGKTAGENGQGHMKLSARMLPNQPEGPHTGAENPKHWLSARSARHTGGDTWAQEELTARNWGGNLLRPVRGSTRKARKAKQSESQGFRGGGSQKIRGGDPKGSSRQPSDLRYTSGFTHKHLDDSAVDTD